VTKLRHALAERQEWVRTIHGYGYRYDGWVEPLDGATGPSPAPIAVPEALPGKPGWQLLRRLGEGGDTWLAECKDTLRVFKLARDAARLTALKREAAVYRLLKAQGADSSIFTVSLRDWNFHAPPYFLEFDYCEQGNLADWLRQQAGALSRVDRLALVANLADQLSALHALGVLHKDLKPANILVRHVTQTPPELALADFGSGGLIDPERLRGIGLTRMGVTVSALDAPGSSGTPVYLAPEVIAGRPWTRQADLYALGVLLYQVLIDDLQRPLAPGWERDIDDPLLCEDIAAACDQSPAHRLTDAAELATRLRQLDARRQRREAERLAAEEAERLRASLVTTRQRRRWQQAVLVSLAAGFAISSILYVDARAARQRAESANQTAQAVTRFLDESLLGAADPYRAGGGHQVTIASVLDTAVRDFAQLERQPDLQLRLGLTLASAYHNLGLESQDRKSVV
jgi:non-specific serine/threonine protein kinase